MNDYELQAAQEKQEKLWSWWSQVLAELASEPEVFKVCREHITPYDLDADDSQVFVKLVGSPVAVGWFNSQEQPCKVVESAVEKVASKKAVVTFLNWTHLVNLPD